MYSTFYSDNRIFKDKSITHDSVIKFARHICNNLIFTVKNLSILDYGGGSGELSYQAALYLLNNKNIENVNIMVVDFSTENAVICTDSRINFHKITPNIFFKEKKTFDLIIAGAVLEHVFFAGSLITELLGLLKPSGYFYSRGPYIIPLYKFLLKFGVEIDTLFPHHFHDFSNKFYESIPYIFDNENLEIVISQPSFFESSFKRHFLRALLSRIIRFPYYLNKNYPFVGGWEIIYKLKS
jgi:2-polyprenyl-3-methyl-5-hydroxy-6-metoxy-1,4-benzoquinol methylase